MGYELGSPKELRFLSRKFGLLKKAIGNTVWVIEGIPKEKKTAFFLHGTYIADRVEIEDLSSNLFVISGPRVKEFQPPFPLNSLELFPALL